MREHHLEPTTEMRNDRTRDVDRLSTRDVLQLMNDEDKTVAFAVERELGRIAQAVDVIVAALERGGRLFYVGAGTSGRLGILDAAECPPTFGTSPELVKGIIAGGAAAFAAAVEGAEDLPELGREDIRAHGVRAGDVVVGIAASGRTPYVVGALEEARASGAATIALTCTPGSVIAGKADVAITVVVGPEVIAGSTRLKAGTAQKMVLNMLSTAAMIRLGKVYGNLMVSVQATNQKLRERVKRIVMEATGVSYAEAAKLAESAGGDARVAIIMQQAGIPAEQARKRLETAGGRVREAIERHG